MGEKKIYQGEEELEKIKNSAKGRNKRFARYNKKNGDVNDEDDDQNFIKKDDKEEIAKKDEVKEGVRPEGNQQRNLDRETGGLEAEEDKGISDEDAWDKRSEDVAKMNEDAQDLNNMAKSTRARGFLHVDKRRKKKMKDKHKNAAEATAGYVEKLTQWRKNDEDNVKGGGGRVI